MDSQKDATENLGSSRCSLSCDNSICVVSPKRGTLGKAELHLAVWHGANPEICDACSLQADCHELFGERGVNCKIHREGNRWVQVSEDQQKVLAGLLR